jgi:3'-phosphoadenosine 5'-phosphosulfate sulfotransferase (PAPS reductase)/FAD synthetase
MAGESRLRLQKWMKYGCNSFETNMIASYPLSIWTEADVWTYIRKYNLPYSPIYDMEMKRTGCMVCGFGCYLKNDRRFYFLKETKPKIYDYFMQLKNNGISYREALQYCEIDFPDSLNKQLKFDF